MMPSDSAPAPLVEVSVPAGSDGAAAVAAALKLAAQGVQNSALLPLYAPASVQERLREAMQASGRGSSTALAATTEPGVSSAAVCVPTSGSTGAPRWVVMPWRTLARAVSARDAVLGGPGAWLVAVPPATAGGVVALARSLQAHTPYESWSGVGGASRFDSATFDHDAERLLERAEAAGVPSRVSLVSAQVGRLLADRRGEATLRRFDTVLVGGGPMSAALRGRAMAAGIKMVHTYGMTETCGGFAYDGEPVAGCDVAISSVGEILVRGDCVAPGYLTGPLTTADGWLRTGDRGSWDGQRLAVQGRIDDVVTVRGANVDLAAVTAAIADQPSVRQAAVVAVEDPDGGHRLRAFVVGEADPSDVRAAVRALLGAAAVPDVVIVDHLPTNPGGKVDVARLQEEAG